ncbi:dipeptide/oligopeptide/nickel ABC transporter permease/ATP-binding protein [Gemmatimonas sp.]|uniref:dipeptide/oligopeptide/nickel ABC transporter permease/ATP-binding protein n=1 Tax=Gemmatimonas sp. TaxID=1962908 RepID=UPI003569BE7F
MLDADQIPSGEDGAIEISNRTPLLLRLWGLLSGFERIITVSMFVILTLTVIGPWIAPKPTEKANPRWRLLHPSWEHYFGTDANGMDIFSRVLASFRVDVAIAVIATSISVILGSLIGVLIAQLEGTRSNGRGSRGLAEAALRILDVIQAFPVFIFAMVLVATRGTSSVNIVAAIAFVNLPVFIRLVRSEVLTLQSRPYAEAAQAIGNSNFRIGYRHLLPNAVPAVIVQISVTIGFAILLTAGLSFVGAGVSPPTPELGAMIAGGSRFLVTGQWWPAVFPGIFLAITVFTFAIFGETIGRLITGGFAAGRVTGGGMASLDPQSSPATGGVTAVTNTPNAPVAALSVPNHALELREDHHHPDRQVREHPKISDMTLLRVANLTVQFDSAEPDSLALDRVSLVINPGDRVGIVGETGSGKSVLVRSILQILPENAQVVSGDISVMGSSLSDMAPKDLRTLRGKTMAAILPNPKAQLNPLVRIGSIMATTLRLHEKGLNKEAVQSRCRAALEQVGISDPERRLRQYPHELSGGMAQRVCIALALLHSPKLLIADEPTSGLDVTVQRQVLDLLAELSDVQGAAQLIVTRDLAIVAHYCTWMGVMHQGRLVEFGRTLEIFDDPSHAHTRELLAAVQADVARGVHNV